MSLRIGIDIGSTTVKVVVLDEENKLLFRSYERHYSKARERAHQTLCSIQDKLAGQQVRLVVTGSAGLGMAKAAGLDFVQEVYATAAAVDQYIPNTDAVIELGGEDAKIIFFGGALEERMNGSCAGGTGAFIDQMATLMNVTIDELDELSLKHEKIYPIASRCGVFAKSDIQPILNQGGRKEDVAASIFQAVVDQTVAGLTQGRELKGKIVFLGGPLHFLQGLRERFVDTLKLDEEHAIFPEDGDCFAAIGAALCSGDYQEQSFDAMLDKLGQSVDSATTIDVMPPLFADEGEYEAFLTRHNANRPPEVDAYTYEGPAYLGIDAGSTTTKIALIEPQGGLLYTYYHSNQGNPVAIVLEQLKEIYKLCGDRIQIRGAAVTGYGEDLIKNAFNMDEGIVETMAHFTAARHFESKVDFILDIGGQDIKCFKIKNKAIDSIMLNEACSSGCGSFIQTFALALGYDIAEFSQLGLFAERPVDLGSRCTVFMNSSVKQAQKDGASVEDISAGLSASIIKNAIYKVIRAKSTDELGKHIVVQGGTFLNDAVLRSFEMELGRNVVRPAIAGLMGAFGCALYAMENRSEKSTLITAEQLEGFTYSAKQINCGGCTAHCNLTVINFGDGRKFISGNRCEKGAGIKTEGEKLCLYEYKYNRLLSVVEEKPASVKAKVGLPLCLGFYEQLPFWHRALTDLGFEVIISEESSRDTYYKGQHTIPSDTVCYPAKLAHGHILSLLERGADFIFYPCESYNIDEGGSDNHYNCPVVAYYPELLKANTNELNDDNFLHPYIDINLENHFAEAMSKSLAKYGVTKAQAKAVWKKSMEAMESYRKDVVKKGEEIIEKARANNMPIIVLSGRPYHIDPEINHGIQKLITSLGLAVITEDSVAHLADTPKLTVLNQWTYHSRLYRAAKYVTTQPDMQLVQLVSFGCGIDAITTDEVRSILEEGGKLYTQLKIDEINNLGAAKIRLRSLVAAMKK